MKHSELVGSGDIQTEIHAFLVGSGNVPVTTRIPEYLCDAVKEAAELRAMGLAASMQMCPIEKLSEGYLA
ncbi:MAG: hypothetical protein LKE27_01135 [Atopobiaceae bacterium]|jgi:hypothetical protein|nr:hypothetical protein [Atopobiaceae bacterium]MCI2051277.1 hypothetical protein [Atopobiaceae bacterium]